MRNIFDFFDIQLFKSLKLPIERNRYFVLYPLQNKKDVQIWTNFIDTKFFELN